MTTSTTLVSHTPKKWIIWQITYLVVLVGFGLYCFYDGYISYPARGIEDASYKQREYLSIAAKAKKLSDASVADPKAELARLEPRQSELRSQANPETPTGLFAKLEITRLDWLQSLALVNRLSPEYTKITDPAESLKTLDEKWNRTSPPKPLTQYDIPLQWVMLVVCAGCSVAVLYVFFRTIAIRYRYDPATQTLTLPDGRTVTPADLSDIDKRKWHKFRCSLVLKNNATPIELDLLRSEPLEDWVLEMEKTAFPDRAAAEEAEDAAAEPSSKTN